MFRFKFLAVLCLIIMMTSSAFAAEKRVNIPIGDSPVIGPNNAPITMIKFVDYQ
ncbi:MAG: hypothetical protein N3A62_08505 [Thermodesulfovibrionales bacterium]|nr:hypothetical protein [Thermodesulfovibrionales bacterium]